MIDFGRGQPDFDLLPLEVMRAAAAARLGGADRRFLQYGLEAGSRGFRRSLAGFLSEGYGSDVSPDSLFVTAGASHGLDLVCGQYTQPGDVILVEEPTYFHALKILKGRGLELVPVACDKDGLRIDALEAALEQPAFEQVKPKLLYTIPTFHNPSGVTMPIARREALIALARAHGFMIVADEVYQLLGYGVTPPPILFDLAGDDVDTVSLGSFSKILAPGVRIGWVQSSPRVIERLGQCGVRQSGGGVSPFTQAIVRSAIDDGLQADYLAGIKAEYRARADILYDSLVASMPEGARLERPEGGYFIWLELPAPLDAASLLAQAELRGLRFKAGPEFTPRDALSRHLRLCFAFLDRATLASGATSLGALVTEALAAG